MPSSYELGTGAFMYCRSLTGNYKVGGPLQVSVPALVFAACNSVNAVTVMKGTRSIGSSFCMECTSLTRTGIPETVEYIYKRAFEGCTHLEKVVCGGEALCHVDEYAFKGCERLTEITFATENPVRFGMGTFMSCYNLKNFAVPPNTVTLEAEMFYDCTRLETVRLSVALNSIGARCFFRCVELRNCDLSEMKNLYVLKEYCFSGSGLPLIDLRQTRVRDVHAGAFSRMSNLTTLLLPETLKSIGQEMCVDCTSLKELVFPKSLEYIPSMTCADCTALSTVRIKHNGHLGEKLFHGCTALQEVTVVGLGTWTAEKE